MSTTLKHWFAEFLAAVLVIVATSSLADETITYIHWDALGSPVAATDESGNVVWRESYRPYGERIDNEPSADSNSRWYTGHPQDADTGFVYAGARYYDPVIGRFLAIDPVDFQEDDLHSFNRYTYANNNPYSYIDPDGREGVGVAIAATGEDSFVGPFGTSGSIKRATQQTATIIETVDNLSSVVMPAKGAVTFVGKQVGKAVTRGVTVSRSRFPESARHIEDAVSAGRSKTLTINRVGSTARRREALRGTETRHGLDRDEFPPAMFQEGGRGASVRHINSADNRGAGACIGAQCRNLPDGTRVRIDVED